MGKTQINTQEDIPAQDMAAFFAGHENACAGELLISGLSGLHKVVGEDLWPGVLRNINTAVEGELDKGLGDGDRVFRVSEDKFVAGITSCGADKAGDLLLRVAENLKQRFMGEDGRESVRFNASMGDGSVDAALSRLTSPGGIPTPRLSSASAEDLKEPVYLPIWDAPNKILAAYVAGHWSMSDDRLIQDEATIAAGTDDVALAKLDATSISETAVLVEDFFANAFAMRMIVRIHYSAYSTVMGQTLILNAMRSIPEHLRKVFTVLVAGVPKDMNPSLIADRLAPIRPLCDTIALEIYEWDDLTAHLSSSGIFSGVSLALMGDAAPRTYMLKQMPKICQDVYRMRKVACVSQLRTRQDIDDAKAAGMRLLSGCAVGDPVDVPANIVRCRARDLPYRP